MWPRSQFYSTGRSSKNPDGIKIRSGTLGWFIVVGVVFLALAPLWHFLPSKRQRHQASLRECAALAGLFVELRDLPLPRARLERLPAAERQVVYYGCRLRPSRSAPQRRHAWYREGGDWRDAPPREPLPALASELPPAVLAIDVGPNTCGLYWREEGDEADVREFASKLLAWRDALTPPPP